MMQTSPCNLWRLEAADRKAAADLVEDGSGRGAPLRKRCRNARKGDYVQTVVRRCLIVFGQVASSLSSHISVLSLIWLLVSSKSSLPSMMQVDLSIVLSCFTRSTTHNWMKEQFTWPHQPTSFSGKRQGLLYINCFLQQTQWLVVSCARHWKIMVLSFSTDLPSTNHISRKPPALVVDVSFLHQDVVKMAGVEEEKLSKVYPQGEQLLQNLGGAPSWNRFR